MFMDVLVEYSNESTSPIRDSNDHSNYGAGIFFLFIAFSLGGQYYNHVLCCHCDNYSWRQALA